MYFLLSKKNIKSTLFIILMFQKDDPFAPLKICDSKKQKGWTSR